MLTADRADHSVKLSKMKNKKLQLFLIAFFSIIAIALLLFRQKVSPFSADRGGAVRAADIPEKIVVGDVISFGRYEQDNDTENGAEAIEWQVLAREDDRALLISRYALDAKPYNDKWTRVTWESSSLRKWLNGEFYNRAFDPAEQNRILKVTNKNPDNPTTGIKGGNDTEDRIFLLSIDEANSYFDTDDLRQGIGSAYAMANGSYINEYNGDSWWWLRSRGSTSKTASLVCFSGYVNMVGYGVNNAGGYLRPVFWLDLHPADELM